MTNQPLAVADLLATLRTRHPHRGKVERAYALFCKRLARAGIARDPAEGPLDFAARAKTQRPDQASKIEAITQLYVALRYGADSKAEWVENLQDLVRRFRVRKILAR